MKQDIKTREDIEVLINQFYSKVKTDQLISFFFIDVVAVDWEKHLPLMYDFWENALFYKGAYEGNPMMVHKALHTKHPMEPRHFIRWNQLFNESVDALFEGEMAETIKQKAQSISTIIQIKLFS